MKDIRCMFGKHRFSDWVEVDSHLERKCLRCPEIEAKYPDPLSTFFKVMGTILWKYHIWLNTPKIMVPPAPKGIYRTKEYLDKYK